MKTRSWEIVVKEMLLMTTPQRAALLAFKAIGEFSDIEMLDGDAAREVAEAWLERWQKEMELP